MDQHSQLEWFDAPLCFPPSSKLPLLPALEKLAGHWRGHRGQGCLVVFFPGVDEDISHNGLFARLTTALGSDTALLGIEPPGVGQSPGARGELPPPASLLSDLELAVRAALSSEPEGTRLVLAGHSMGGAIATILADRLNAAGIGLVGSILLAPAVDTLIDEAFSSCSCPCFGCCCNDRHGCSMLAPIWCGIYRLMRCLVLSCKCTALLPIEDAARYPSMLEEERDELVASLAVERMTATGVTTVVELMQIVQQGHWKPAAPTLMVMGSDDWAVPPRSIRSLARARGMAIVPIAAGVQDTVAECARSHSACLFIDGADHHVLHRNVPWNGGSDVAGEVVLPAIRAWVRSKRGEMNT